MKLLLILLTVFFLPLRTVAQSALLLDTERLETWEADSLYAEADRGIGNLQNSPNTRLRFVKIGLDRAKEDDNNAQAANFATKGAVVFTELGLNQQALQYALEAKQYAEQTPSKKDDIWNLYRLSDIHAILKNSEKALEDAHESLRLAIERDTAIEIGWSYNALGEAHRNFMRFDSATYYYQKGLEAFQKVDYKRGVQFCHQNMGLNYSESGAYDRALEEFSTSASIGLETDVLFNLEMGNAMLKIIEVKYSLDSAIAYGLEMAEVAERANFPIWVKGYKGQLAELYRKKGDWEAAWKYLEESDSLEEIQTGERIRQQTSVLDHQHRLQLLEAEHEVLAQENRNRVLLWFSILIVVALLGVVAMVQIAKNRRVKKGNEQLFIQNANLDDLIKEKDIWINLMAHDLKAPLSAISALLDMLRDENLPEPVGKKVLGNITKAVNKGSELISQLLEIARLESSEEKAQIQSVNVKDLVRETEAAFQSAAEKKNILLLTELPESDLLVDTDPIYVQRILENLVSNALKFSTGGKEVRIVLQSQAELVTVHVVDQGPGMTAEDEQSLFQKFKKLSARPTAGESSTGLGLSIVKLLVDRIGAHIFVETELGKGSTFSLALPRKASATTS